MWGWCSILLLSYIPSAVGSKQCSTTLLQGHTYSYHGKSTSGTLELTVSINSKDSLTLSSVLSVSGAKAYTETFSVKSSYLVDASSCMLFLSQPGLSKITVSRSGGKPIVYYGGPYLFAVLKMFTRDPPLVAADMFGIVKPDTNQIVLNEKIKLELKIVAPPNKPVIGASPVRPISCPSKLSPDSQYRLVISNPGISLAITLHVSASNTLRLQTMLVVAKSGVKQSDYMSADGMSYTINRQTCMLIIVGDAFDAVNVARKVNGAKSETVKYIGRVYLNSLVRMLGGTGFAGKRTIGQVSGSSTIRLDKLIDLKRI